MFLLVCSFYCHILFWTYKQVIMIDSCKLLTIFQVKLKRTNQSYSPLKVSKSIWNGALMIAKWQVYQQFLSRLKITKMKWKQRKLWSFDKMRKCFNWKKTYMDGQNMWILLNIEANQMRQRKTKLCVAWPSTKWPWKIKVMLC